MTKLIRVLDGGDTGCVQGELLQIRSMGIAERLHDGTEVPLRELTYENWVQPLPACKDITDEMVEAVVHELEEVETWIVLESICHLLQCAPFSGEMATHYSATYCTLLFSTKLSNRHGHVEFPGVDTKEIPGATEMYLRAWLDRPYEALLFWRVARAQLFLDTYDGGEVGQATVSTREDMDYVLHELMIGFDRIFDVVNKQILNPDTRIDFRSKPPEDWALDDYDVTGEVDHDSENIWVAVQDTDFETKN